MDARSFNLSIIALERFCQSYKDYRTETGFLQAPADQYRGAMPDDSDELVDQFVDLTINGEHSCRHTSLHMAMPSSVVGLSQHLLLW
jgi:hypothetical protein